MKYYIATSNLNLDNILQSECILPFPHYGHRVSGYKTFEQIEELRPFSGVVLFAFPVSFEINDPGRYNYPLLIEFEDGDVFEIDTPQTPEFRIGMNCIPWGTHIHLQQSPGIEYILRIPMIGNMKDGFQTGY